VKRAYLVLACLATLAAAKPAAAYVRYTLASGVMFKWPQSCVMLTAYPADFVSKMPLEDIVAATTASADAWSVVSNSCTYLDIMVDYSTAPAPRANPRDVQSMIIYRTMNWCKLMPNGQCDTTVYYDPAALALTTVSAKASSGQITDADIEVNAFHFMWGDLVANPPSGAPQAHDLRNAMTHEMGHLIGLDHTCFPPGITTARPNDDMGQPIPDCSEATQEVIETTMFPSANSGDVDKRTLGPDDQRAVCEIYAAADNPNVCKPVVPADDGGCDCGAAARSTAATPVAATLVVAFFIWRRRRRRDSSS
jgi:MYXO-CTERM domain-containing protein